ncbi:MAG: hypothetical protein R8G66_02795 [Cytophagales bacterium]|nr:hypothetical protein [Cytophagales bacterium]
MEDSRKYKAGQITPKDLSNHELKQKLDLYSKGDERQFFDIQKIKQRYLNQDLDTQNKRSQSDLYYAKGIRSGLPHTSYDRINQDREYQDQKFRDSIIEEAKPIYRRHKNLSRDFNESDNASASKENLRNLSQNFKKYGVKPSPSKEKNKEFQRRSGMDRHR